VQNLLCNRADAVRPYERRHYYANSRVGAQGLRPNVDDAVDPDDEGAIKSILSVATNKKSARHILIPRALVL